MTINWVNWDEIPDGVVKSYSAMFLQNEPALLVSNVQTTFKVLKVGPEIYFPVTINYEEWENSYVCSPFTAYALYSRSEIQRKIKSKFVRFALLMLVGIISKLLRCAKINKNIHINNFLLSTNPYPAWNGQLIDEITRFIKSEYPAHAIIFRSLNQYQHDNLMCVHQHMKYRLVASRQIYMYDLATEDWRKHNNNRQDVRIIKNKKLEYLGHEDMREYLEEALLLYQQLYLEKYSVYNPAFTIHYFNECHKNKIIIFQGYKDENNGLKAFSGLFVLDNTITSPLVGYDTKAPQKDALYIHAIHLIFNYKFDTGKILNLSSGAPLFKRLRGGKPVIEYSAIYVEHLKWARRLIWKFLQFLSNKVGVILMKKYKL